MQVFITATERCVKLTPELQQRLDNIISLDAKILIGNYKGGDQTILSYLRKVGYKNVQVIETGSRLTFGFPLMEVGRYPAQDIYMSKQADYMLAVHDGKSKGVKANLNRFPKDKTRLVYI